MDVLERLEDVIDELAAMEPQQLGSGDDMLALSAQLDRLEAVRARALGAFEASKAYMDNGCRSAAHWLAWKRHMPISACRQQVASARALRHLPAAERAWLDGEITGAHVRALAAARTPGTEEVFERDEKLLVDDAKALRYSSFCRALSYWRQLAAPEDCEDDAQSKRDRRGLDLSETFEGMFVGDLTADPVAGAIIATELKRIYDELYLLDWAEAKGRLGRDPHVDELGRTPRQRRLDAMVEMAIRSRTAPAGGRRPEPLLTVVIGWDRLRQLCELANGTVITPGSLIEWLPIAWVERVVFESPSRVIDVGVQRRLFDGATRRAVEIRDRECFHPSCEERFEDCQVDHIQPWSYEGPTTQDNGRLACGFHNRERHRRREPPAP